MLGNSAVKTNASYYTFLSLPNFMLGVCSIVLKIKDDDSSKEDPIKKLKEE
jgi:hypothetical protein